MTSLWRSARPREAVLRHCLELEAERPGWIPFFKLPFMGPPDLPPGTGHLALEDLRRVCRRRGMDDDNALAMAEDPQLRREVLEAALEELQNEAS